MVEARAGVEPAVSQIGESISVTADSFIPVAKSSQSIVKLYARSTLDELLKGQGNEKLERKN
jgi:hypothetical protein